MKYLFILFLCSSCSLKYLTYTLPLNVKEYNNNVLTSCGERMVTIQHNEQYINFLDISLRYKNRFFRDCNGTPYNYFYEINNNGLILFTVAPSQKSYIISTKGTCSP